MERHGAIADPLLRTPRLEPGEADSRARRQFGVGSLAGHWPAAACVGVALTGPTLAIAANERWGSLIAAGVMLAWVVALVLFVSLALRQRDAWLQAQARREQLESGRRAAMGIAGATLPASDSQTAEHSGRVAS